MWNFLASIYGLRNVRFSTADQLWTANQTNMISYIKSSEYSAFYSNPNIKGRVKLEGANIPYL